MKDTIFVIGIVAAICAFLVAVTAWLTVLPVIGLLWCVGAL